ncbi:MAG: MarR family winged helix-turn-helix transcriptional regulator [Burkholderiaceae bacterium]
MPRNRIPAFRNLLSYEVNRASDLLRRGASMRFRREQDVSLMEWRTLARIQAMQPVTLRELVDHASTDKAQISRIVTALTSQGWVERTAHATDARSATLALTDEGVAIIRALTRVARDRDKTLRAALTAREAEQLVAILGKLQASAQALIGIEESHGGEER